MFKLTSTVKVDNTAKTITVTLKNGKGVPNQAADVSKKVELGPPEHHKIQRAVYAVHQRHRRSRADARENRHQALCVKRWLDARALTLP